MAELVDALDSGSSVGSHVGVRVPSSAPPFRKGRNLKGLRLFHFCRVRLRCGRVRVREVNPLLFLFSSFRSKITRGLVQSIHGCTVAIRYPRTVDIHGHLDRGMAEMEFPMQRRRQHVPHLLRELCMVSPELPRTSRSSFSKKEWLGVDRGFFHRVEI